MVFSEKVCRTQADIIQENTLNELNGAARTQFLKNCGSLERIERRHVYANARMDVHLQADKSSHQTMVILESPQDDEAIVIGTLAEIGPRYMSFDYLVTDKILENNVNWTGRVQLKRDSDFKVLPEQIPCVIVSDFDNQEGSFFDLPIRRCILRLIRQ